MSGEETAPGEDTAPGGESAPDRGPDPDANGEPGGDIVPGGRPAGSGLDETDRQILAIENQQWKYQGAKEMEIRRRLGLSPTRYYQRLNVLIDTRAALEHDPMLVGRLRRQRGDPG